MQKPNLTKVFNGVKIATVKHSPEILMGIGITGMVTTTVMAVRATPKALMLIETEKRKLNYELLEEAKKSGSDVCNQITRLETIDLIKVNGPHTLMSSDTYYIVDKDGNKIASFSGTRINLGNGMAVMTVDEINLGKGKAIFATDHVEVANGAAYFSPSLLKLGNRDSSEVQLCNGKGKIKMDGDVLLISGNTALGLRNVYRNYYFAETVCRSDSNNPVAAIQAYRGDGVGSSVIADMNGVRVNVPSNKNLSVNGREVLLSNTLMAVGTVVATGSIKKGKTASLTAKVPVPSGYSLAGIREIKTNHNNACRMTQFYTHPSANQVGATFVNTSNTDFTNKDMSKSNKKLQVTIEWFAFRCSAATVSGDNIIDWVED